MIQTVHIVPILKDNYCYVVEGNDKQCVIIDPGQTKPVEALIDPFGLTPVAILNTHHHADHVAGNHELKVRYDVPVIGPKAEANKIPHMDSGLAEGGAFNMGGITFQVMETPGHTQGHICFYNEEKKILFSGDTLFSMGCGRLLEGTPEDMWNSLQRLKLLPDDTLVYCGHEYTESNGAFAIHVMPQNNAIPARLSEVRKYRMNDMPSLPVTLQSERLTNPFLMARTVEEFAALRRQKDNF